MTATLSLNLGLGVYSSAYGTAQLLNNGNWWFHAGHIEGGSDQSRMYEFNAGGVLVYELSYPAESYRSFRLSTLFAF